MIAVMPAEPSRRQLLRAGGLGLGALALAGCSGDRLRTPWSPAPTDDAAASAALPPDTDLLVAARLRLHRYRETLPQVRARTPAARRASADLADLWATQQERLEALLTAAGVGLPALGAVDLPASGDGAAATIAAPGDQAAATSSAPDLRPEDLGTIVRDDLQSALEELARSTVTNRAVLTSLTAQHAESARLLRAAVDWPPLVGPVGAAAVPLLQVTRPAVFGLEVVAARAKDEERETFEAVLAPLRSTTRALTTLAGDAAPVPPLGYDLPEPLSSAKDRMALARSLVHDVAPAALAVVDRAGSDVGQLGSVVRIVGEATAWARTLRSPLAPFPGMTLP